MSDFVKKERRYQAQKRLAKKEECATAQYFCTVAKEKQ
jgi:hypothetical protein